jgi:murein DD-endopeptidase MepM/ murein hydrolase activator NlpD
MAVGKALLLPTVPGIFVSETPGSSLEYLLSGSRAGDDQNRGVSLSVPREGKTERFLFIPGDDFSPTERVFFFNRDFRFPLRNFQVSSAYGPRVNPVTMIPGMHRGIDFAAPLGSEVYATKSGTVVDIGEDPVLGKYIIISHDNSWVSLYAHLSAINTALNSQVQSASLIARVGSTGQSTGPHLHFELRQNGQDRDPARLLGLFRGTGQ